MNHTTEPEPESKTIFCVVSFMKYYIFFITILFLVLNSQRSFLKISEKKGDSPSYEEISFNKQKDPIGLNSEQKINDEPPTKTLLLPILKKFIYVLKKSTKFYKFKSLTENAYSLINDPSDIYTKIQSQNVFFFFSKELSRNLNYF